MRSIPHNTHFRTSQGQNTMPVRDFVVQPKPKIQAIIVAYKICTLIMASPKSPRACLVSPLRHVRWPSDAIPNRVCHLATAHK